MSDPRIPIIQELRTRGLSWRKVGDAIGISPSRAHQILRATGANTGRSCADLQLIRNLYFGGRTMAQVAKHSKVTKGVVSQALHMMGVEVRQGGPRRPRRKVPSRLVALRPLHC